MSITFYEFLKKFYESQVSKRLQEGLDPEDMEFSEEDVEAFNPDLTVPTKGYGQTDPTEPFKEYLFGPTLKAARDAWEEKVKTNEGQLACIEASGHEDFLAAVYLYYRYFKITCQIFWQYFARDDRSAYKAFNTEMVEQLAASAFDLLCNKPGYPTSDATPYRAFKAEKYEHTKDFLNHFMWWYARYFQATCEYYAKHMTVGGITGYNGKGPLSLTGYDELAGGDDEGFEYGNVNNLASHGNLDAVSYRDEDPLIVGQVRAALADFRTKIPQKAPANELQTYLGVWDDMLLGMKSEITKAKFGITIDDVHRVRANLERWLKKDHPELAELR